MPLQEADLETIEAYKAAIRKDVTKLSDTSKIKYWVYKDVELPDGKGKKQKIKAFVVLVDDAKVKPKLRNKKLVSMGTCRLDQSRVCFEFTKGGPPYASLKLSVPLFLGKVCYIPAGKEDSDGDEGGEGIESESEQSNGTQPQNTTAPQNTVPQVPPPGPAPQPPGVPPPQSTMPPAPDPMGLEVQAAWQKLGRQAQQLMAVNPAHKEEITRAGAAIQELIKNQKFPDAKQQLKTFEQLLNSVSAPKGPSPAAVKEAWAKLAPRIKASGNAPLNQALQDLTQKLGPLVSQGKTAEAQKMIDDLTDRLEKLKPETKSPEGKESKGHETEEKTSKLTSHDVVAAWQKMLPELEKKSKTDPQLKQMAAQAFKRVQDLIKAGDLDAAQREVNSLAEFLTRLDSEGEKEQPEKEQEETKADPRQVQYERLLQQMEPEIEEALKANRGDVSRIRTAVGLASDRAAGGDYASAIKVLENLTPYLHPEEDDDDDKPVAGLVEYRKQLAFFDTARHKAESQASALVAAIPEMDEEWQDIAEDLEEALEDELADLKAVIDAAVNAANNVKAPANAALKKQIETALGELKTNKVFELADTNKFGVKVDIRDSLTKALQDVLGAMPVEV